MRSIFCPPNLDRCFLTADNTPFRFKTPHILDNEHIKAPLKQYDVHRDAEWAFEGETLLKFPEETESLRTLLVTWNMYGNGDDHALDLLLNDKKVDHHIIVISTQECLRSISRSVFKECKKKWISKLRNHLGSKYHILQYVTMNALNMIIFARKEVKDHITNIKSADEATGFAHFIGNKGGIGISFDIKGKSFLFINAHLAAGKINSHKRNEHYEKITENILKELTKPKLQDKVTDCFDFVFFMGDLNYRINIDLYETISLFRKGDFETLLSKDQLNIEMSKPYSPYAGFNEGKIRFAPTYKYEKYNQNFNAEKLRAPAWCDRILFAHRSAKGSIEQASYDSIRKVFGSDHRPVFSQFVISLSKPTKMQDSLTSSFFEQLKMKGSKGNNGQCCWWKTTEDKIDAGDFDTFSSI